MMIKLLKVKAFVNLVKLGKIEFSGGRYYMGGLPMGGMTLYDAFISEQKRLPLGLALKKIKNPSFVANFIRSRVSMDYNNLGAYGGRHETANIYTREKFYKLFIKYFD